MSQPEPTSDVLHTTSLGIIPASAQTTGLLTFFLLDSQPLSLEASVVTINTVSSTPTVGGPFTVPVTTLEIACPTAASPDNDACRAAGIYPAQVQHTQGSVFGGTTTRSADDSTTTWVCALGNAGVSYSADCTKTIAGGINNGARSTRTETTRFDNCYVGAHQRPVVVTAGVDRISQAHYLTGDASAYLSAQSSLQSSEGCPASQTTLWAGGVVSLTGSVSATFTPTAPFRASVGSESHRATTQSNTTVPGQTSSRTGSASPTAPNGAARDGVGWSRRLFVGMGVIAMFSLAL